MDEATTLDADYHFEGEIEIEMPSSSPAPQGGMAAFAQDSDSISTFHAPSTSRKKRDTTTAPLIMQTPSNIPQRVTPTTDRRPSTDEMSRSSNASPLIAMETLESTVQETVQWVIADGLSAMIQQVISQSMASHMQNLALSAGNQNETAPLQQWRSQGHNRQSASQRGNDGVATDG